MGVSDFLMMSLAKLTVAVGKQVKDAVADTEVHTTYVCQIISVVYLHTTYIEAVVRSYFLSFVCGIDAF